MIIAGSFKFFPSLVIDYTLVLWWLHRFGVLR
jgi:hypothetical protein